LGLEDRLPQEMKGVRGQVVRTRPDQLLFGAHEKEIKDAYLQVVRHANNYILLVNQYFQYNRLARQIKDWKQITNDAFKAHSEGKEPRTLYLFLGTCKSEKDGMVFRTQQMANEFGTGDQFENAFKEMYDVGEDDPNNGEKRPARMKTVEDDFGKEIEVPNIDYVYPTEHLTSKDMGALHIKPLLFMFYTPIPHKGLRDSPANRFAQQVYVHAKLMIEDDAFFTLGSANTNIRSFAVDSELNIISDDGATAKKTRYDLLKEYVGEIKKEFGEEFHNTEGEVLTQTALESIYLIMKQRMQDNYEAVMIKKETIEGLIVKFHDDRTVDVVRVA
ncbi:MAG: phospholipase D-like domain-containing protein, partial [Saezia sp.]